MTEAVRDGLLGVGEVTVVLVLALGAVLYRSTLRRAAVAALRRLDPRRPPLPTSSHRPIEDLATGARRLRRALDEAPPGRSYARWEGTRRAYDQVLAEVCSALDVEQHLDELRPGLDLDAERLRVEHLLRQAGVRLHPGDAA